MGPLLLFIILPFILINLVCASPSQKIDSNAFCEADINGVKFQCSFGRTGVAINKKEGDGATPVGNFPLRKIFYRPDRINRSDIKTNLPVQALTPNKGWCDDVNCIEYNTEITLPFSGSHEELWREDNIYDLIVVVGYNDQPVVKGKGSAIFLHIARENYTPTAGCIAFSKQDLLNILTKLNADSMISISKQGKVEFII